MAAVDTRRQNSTNVRTRFAAPQPVRTAFTVLEHVAPGIGARWAARLWCTVPGHPEARQRGPGRRAGLLSTVDLPGGRSVVTESWGSGPNVYLIHGWGGSRGQLDSFVDQVVSRGYRAIAFDALSHGDSSGGVLGPERTTLGEFAEALTAVVERQGDAAGVIGHSLGCAATAVAVRDGLSVPRFGFVAPSVQPIGLTRDMARGLGFGSRTHDRMIRSLESIVGRPMSDFDLLNIGNDVAMPPTLVVHDREDRDVAYAEAERLVTAWPQADLVTTSGLGHRRILRDPDVVDLVTAFVAP
jgi:pimeloyl-ACP methyl ester carboxylesterase